MNNKLIITLIGALILISLVVFYNLTDTNDTKVTSHDKKNKLFPPSHVTALPGEEESRIYWNKADNSDSYTIIWWTEKNDKKKYIKNVQSPYYHENLNPDLKYFYSLKSVSENLESKMSNIVECTPYSSQKSSANISGKAKNKKQNKNNISDRYAMPGQEIPEEFPDSGKPPEKMPDQGSPSAMPDDGKAPEELPKALQTERFKDEKKIIHYSN